MLAAITTLLACQLVGEGIVHLLALPVPGPVVGLVILALGLVARERFGRAAEPLGDTALGRTATTLLSHLSLLFVPAAVGVVQQGGVLAADGLAIAVALVLSTVLTLVVTALVFVGIVRLTTRPDGSPERDR